VIVGDACNPGGKNKDITGQLYLDAPVIPYDIPAKAVKNAVK